MVLLTNLTKVIKDLKNDRKKIQKGIKRPKKKNEEIKQDNKILQQNIEIMKIKMEKIEREKKGTMLS